MKTKLLGARIANRPRLALTIAFTAVVAAAVAPPLVALLYTHPQPPPPPVLHQAAAPEPARVLSAETLYKQGLDLLDQKDYASAIKLLGAAREQSMLQFGILSSNYRECCEQLLRAQEGVNNKATAKELREELQNLTQFAFVCRDIEKSSRRLAELTAKRLTDSNNRKINEEYGRLLNEQAWLYLGKKNQKEADTLATNALKFHEKYFGVDSPGALNSAIFLAKIKGNRMDLDSAEALDRQLLAKAEKTFGIHSWQVVQCYVDLGCNETRRLCLKVFANDQQAARQAYTNAKDNLNKACTISDATFSVPSPWKAEALGLLALTENMAWIGHLENNLQRAHELAQKNYDLQSKLTGTSSPATAAALAGLADVEVNIASQMPTGTAKTALFKEADLKLERAQGLVGESLSLARILNYRAFAHELMGDTDGAEKFFNAGFAKARRWKLDSDVAQQAYNGLMRIYQKQDRKDKQVSLMKEVQAKPGTSNKELP